MPKLCLKYNEVPRSYLKHIESVIKKLNPLTFHFKNKELCMVEQF